MTFIRSCWRVTWDPAGSPVILLAWNNLTTAELEIPWAQDVQVEPLVGSSWPAIIARGNVRREIRFSRLEAYSTAHELRAAVIACDAAVSALAGLTKPLDIDSMNATTGMPWKSYRSPVAAITGHTASVDDSGTRVLRVWTVTLAGLTLQS